MWFDQIPPMNFLKRFIQRLQQEQVAEQQQEIVETTTMSTTTTAGSRQKIKNYEE